MPHIVKRVEDAEPQDITCGTMRKLTDTKDFKGMDFVHVTVKDETKEHYHRKLTEAYYVLEGSIDVKADGKTEHLKKGSLILILPNTKHKAWKTSKEDAQLLVACCPPWSEEDEIMV